MDNKKNYTINASDPEEPILKRELRTSMVSLIQKFSKNAISYAKMLKI